MKLGVLILISSTVLLLTACVMQGDRESILKALDEYAVLNEDWKFVTIEEEYNSVIPIVNKYNYIYKDEFNNFHMVCISDLLTSEDGNDSFYPVTIYDSVETDKEERNTVSDNTIVSETVTVYKPATDSVASYYEVREHRLLFWKGWSVEPMEVE